MSDINSEENSESDKEKEEEKAKEKKNSPNSYPGFVGNTNKFNAALEVIAEAYDPANPQITIDKLLAITELISKDHELVIKLLSPYHETLGPRNIAYDFMSVYKTLILSALKSSLGVTKEQVLTATNLGKRVDGTRVKSIKKPPSTNTVDSSLPIDEQTLDALVHNSVSHQQFDVRLSSFYAFITNVTGCACYNTNNEKLKLEAIMVYYDSFAELNHKAQVAEGKITIARQTRDNDFFNLKIGARLLFNQAKDYIKSEFGTKSAEYKLVKGLSFLDLRLKSKR